MHKEKKILILILGLIFMSVIIKPIVSVVQAQEQKKSGSIQASQPDALRIAKPKVEYTASDFKDPFRLFQAPKETKKVDVIVAPVNPPELEVSGLVWGAENPQAIVNGKVVKVGDTLEDARIDSIGKGGIVIEFSGKKFTLPVTTKISSNDKHNNENIQGSPIGVPKGVPQGGQNAR